MPGTSIAELGRDAGSLPELPEQAGGQPPGTAPTGAELTGTGRLAQLRDWLARAQGAASAGEPRRARLLHLGAGDGCPPALADLAQLSVRIEAGTADAVADQLAAGAAVADAEVDSGTDLLVLSLPGAEVLGPTVICLVTGIEPVKLLSPRLPVAEWTRRTVAVRDARRALLPDRTDPQALLAGACRSVDDISAAGEQHCGLAVACGALLRATARRTPVLLQGVGAAAAAVVSAEVAPQAASWWRVTDVGADPAIDAAAAHLGVPAVLPMAVDGPPGTAAALAVLALRVAVRSFAS